MYATQVLLEIERLDRTDLFRKSRDWLASVRNNLDRLRVLGFVVRDDQGRYLSLEKPDRITPLGIGRDRPEPPASIYGGARRRGNYLVNSAGFTALTQDVSGARSGAA